MMAGKAKAVPDGFNTVSPHMVVRGAKKAIDFYKKAFGAEGVVCMPGPDGESVMHGEIKIGNSTVMIHDEFPGPGPKAPDSLNGTSVKMHLYVEDVDALFKRAVAAGATPTMPVADMFWGDRYGMVTDPFGHHWGIATHKEDLTPEEIGQRAEAFFSSMGDHACGEQ
jgi:uncharacterized glyoxalase superfamily protein PhnB